MTQTSLFELEPVEDKAEKPKPAKPKAQQKKKAAPKTAPAAAGTDSLQLEQFLCFSLYSANHAMNRVYKPLLKELGLTYPQYLAMTVLWQKDKVLVGDLGDRLHLESNTMTPLLKRLEASGHVTRARNPENERQVLIHVTAKGRGLQTEAGCMGERLIANAGMDLEELAALNRQVRQLRDNLNRHLQKQAPK